MGSSFAASVAAGTLSFTFAVVGHNEEPHLAAALHQALLASRIGDRVVFVDSASTDGSARIAEEVGVEVLAAPLGKGRAVRAALEYCKSDYLCLLDADIVDAELNIAERLRWAATELRLDMIVGQFWSRGASVLTSTVGVYGPMVEAFFPEVSDRYGSRPLSGFRVLRPDHFPGLPGDFGVESHLNIEVVMRGGGAAITDIGCYGGRYRHKPDMPFEIAGAILDLAERHGRLDPELRGDWEEWVRRIVELFSGYHGGEDQRERYRRRLFEALALPRPPARLAASPRSRN